MSDKTDKEFEVESMLLNCTRDLSKENATLVQRVNDERRLVYVLSVLTLVFGMASGFLFYINSTREVKYALSSVDGRIIPFTMYDVPYKKVKDRIQFVENTAYRLNSLSWYDRADILTELYPRFYESTFNDILKELDQHSFLNKDFMQSKKISTAATFVKGAKLIDPAVKNIKGFASFVTGEEYEMVLMQEIRRNGVDVLKLKFELRMVIVRVDPNEIAEGYKITKYKIKAQ